MYNRTVLKQNKFKNLGGYDVVMGLIDPHFQQVEPDI